MTKPLVFLLVTVLILEGAKAQVLCLQPLTLGHSKKKAAQTVVSQGESSVGGTREPCR